LCLDSSLNHLLKRLRHRGGRVSRGLSVGCPRTVTEHHQRTRHFGIGSRSFPGEDSSSGYQRLGHISKQGNTLLRFLLVEAAQAAVRSNPDWRRQFLHLAMRRERRIAKVALARKLAVRLYWMWRKGWDYQKT